MSSQKIYLRIKDGRKVKSVKLSQMWKSKLKLIELFWVIDSDRKVIMASSYLFIITDLENSIQFLDDLNLAPPGLLRGPTDQDPGERCVVSVWIFDACRSHSQTEEPSKTSPDCTQAHAVTLHQKIIAQFRLLSDTVQRPQSTTQDYFLILPSEMSGGGDCSAEWPHTEAL